MNTEMIILVAAIAVAAILFYVQHRRNKGTVAVTTELAGAIKAVPSLVASHVELATGALKAKVDAATTVLRADIAKAVGSAATPTSPAQATHAAPAPVDTRSAAPDAPAPAPAAPVPTIGEPPPASVAASPQPSGGSGTEWPQVIEVDGVHLLAGAPINPSFKFDAQTKAYDNAHSYLFDPSNGAKCVPPQPTRSPAGYPLFYAIGAGNAPVGPARVLYNGNTFPDDAAVAAYIAAVAAARAAGDVAAAAAAAQVFAGPVPLTALTKSDLEFLWWATSNAATPKLHNWQFDVLSGSRVAIQQALASVSGDIAWLRKYDAAGYKGVLRSHYDAAVKA